MLLDLFAQEFLDLLSIICLLRGTFFFFFSSIHNQTFSFFKFVSTNISEIHRDTKSCASKSLGNCPRSWIHELKWSGRRLCPEHLSSLQKSKFTFMSNSTGICTSVCMFCSHRLCYLSPSHTIYLLFCFKPCLFAMPLKNKTKKNNNKNHKQLLGKGWNIYKIFIYRLLITNLAQILLNQASSFQIYAKNKF